MTGDATNQAGVAGPIPNVTVRGPSIYQAGQLAPRVAIEDDGRLLATLGKVMVGWAMTPAPEGGPASSIRVRRERDAWTLSGAGYSEPVRYHDPVATACSLIAALYKVHSNTRPDGFCLHAAGVRIGPGLVLMTGAYRAGKSLLAATCAANGLQVFSDDIIPVAPDGRTARAPGLAIRLRLPLPETLGSAVRRFIEAHRVAASDRYLYLRPPSDRLAACGDAAPIRAIVRLDRSEGAGAQLSRLDPGEAMAEAIRRNFARELPAGVIVDAFDRLAAEVPILRLSYGRTDDAAACLAERLTGALNHMPSAAGSASSHIAARTAQTVLPLPPDAPVRRGQGARLRVRGAQAFLTDAEDLAIFNLNATASAVWNLLDRPARFGEIVDTFRAAFPEADAGALAADLAALLRDLERHGLVSIDPP